jgi:dihydroorotase
MQWDILIKGGTVVDPGQGLHAISDVAISGDKIAVVDVNLDPANAAKVIDATGKIVTPGFIDLHVHNYTARGNRPSVDSDSTSLAFGVTTALDAGTATPSQYPHYWETDIQSTKVRLYSLVRMPDPYGPDPSSISEVQEMMNSYDTLIGVKYHHSQHFAALPMAREAVDFGGGMLMAEAYGAPMRQLLDWLNPGDIMTHTFHAAFRFPIFDHRGNLWQEVLDAVERGVILDVGHGARGFAFRTVEQAMEQGLKPTTISTDLHVGNIDGPVYDMPTTMSKMMAVGLSLDEVVEMSTSVPAKALNEQDRLGALKPGYIADVVVSELEQGQFTYMDVLHEKRVGREKINAETVIYSGRIYDGDKFVPGDMTHKEDAPPGFILTES